jgi:hypothetical protein
MANLQTFDQYIDRLSNGYVKQIHYASDAVANTTATIFNGQLLRLQLAPIAIIGSYPVGVAGLRLVNATCRSSTIIPSILGTFTYLGAYNYATGIFDTGNAMPTVTEGNVTRITSSAVCMYVLTTLTLTSGTVSTTVQYTDQDGNVGAAAPAFTFTTGATQGTCGFLRLASGDDGARDITNVTVAGGGIASGVIGFFGFSPFGTFAQESRVASTPSQLNFLTEKPTPPLLQTGDQLGLITLNNVARRLQGTLYFIGEQP